MGILEELYYGNINPNQKMFDRHSTYGKSMHIVSELEDVISNLLSEQEKNLLVSLMSAQAEINAITAKEYFIIGFKLGTKIGLAILSDDDSCLHDIT